MAFEGPWVLDEGGLEVLDYPSGGACSPHERTRNECMGLWFGSRLRGNSGRGSSRWGDTEAPDPEENPQVGLAPGRVCRAFPTSLPGNET